MKLVSTLSLLCVAALSMATAPTTKELLTKAQADGLKSGKNVLVIFHASWCGWCHKFDDFLEKTDEGKLVKNGLEIVHVTVLENDPKQKVNENEGGVDFMTELGGKDAGLPFMAIIDSKTGKMVVNSLMKEKDQASNTGYPAKPEEIKHFMKMLDMGAKKLRGTDKAKIQAWLTANAPH